MLDQLTHDMHLRVTSRGFPLLECNQIRFSISSPIRYCKLE